MGAVPSRETPDTIFSLRYGGHEIGLVPLVRRYFSDNNKELKRQFIRVWNDPSVRYHYPQNANVSVTKLPPPTYTKEDLEAFLDVVEKDLFDTNEDFMQASIEAAEYYATRERDESSLTSVGSSNSDPVSAFMSGPPSKKKSSSHTGESIIDSKVPQPYDGDSEKNGQVGCSGNNDSAEGVPKFSIFESLESVQSSSTNFIFPHYASHEGLSERESPQNLIPSSLLLESFNESGNVFKDLDRSKTGKQVFYNPHQAKETRLSRAEMDDNPITKSVSHGVKMEKSAEDRVLSCGGGNLHLAPHKENIPLPATTSKSEGDLFRLNTQSLIAKARRCKRAIRPVPCAVLFVYVSGRKEADCFSLCGRRANVIGYFGCRTHNDERDDDVPYLQPCNIVLKAAGDRTVERVLILAARLYVEQYGQILAQFVPESNRISFFQQRFQSVRMLVSALWNNYPTLKFVYDTAALLWAMSDIDASKCPPSVLWHENEKNHQQRLLIRLDGIIVSRVWVWMANLASVHMQRGNWLQFVLSDFTQYKDKFVSNWLDTNETAEYFLRDREFTKRVQQHLDQLHKEILRARETEQSDTTQWSDQQERSYDGKLYRIFLSPYCGPFLTTVKFKEAEEQGGGLSGSNKTPGWASFTGHNTESFSDQKKGQWQSQKPAHTTFHSFRDDGTDGKGGPSGLQQNTAQSGERASPPFMLDPSQPHVEGVLPHSTPVSQLKYYVPSPNANNNVFLATQMPVNGTNMYSTPFLPGASSLAWDLPTSSPSEKTFSNIQHPMMAAPPMPPGGAVLPVSNSLPVIYYPGVNAFGSVGDVRTNVMLLPNPLNRQRFVSSPKDAETQYSNGGTSNVCMNNSTFCYLPVPSLASIHGDVNGGRNNSHQDLGSCSDRNTSTSELQSFSVLPMYQLVGNGVNGNGSLSSTGSMPVLCAPGAPLYPASQQQPPVFQPNYVMLSDGRITTTF